MGEKVSFNPITKIISIASPPDSSSLVTLDVKEHIYSDGKQDWKDNSALTKFRFPIDAVGGNPLPGSKALGSTFFLKYGWRIRPYEATHTLRVNGNLYTEEGDSPYVPTLGNYNVMVESSVSSLVDSTIQQLAEIEYNIFNGGVTIDVVNGVAGTAYPTGSPGRPVNNLTDAYTIATTRNFKTLFIKGNLTVNSSNFDDFTFSGNKSTVTLSASINGGFFRDCIVTGTVGSRSRFYDCVLSNLTCSNIVVHFFDSAIVNTVYLTNGIKGVFVRCVSAVSGDDAAVVDLNNDGSTVEVREFNGKLKIKNKNGSEIIALDMSSGTVVLDSTITAGTVVLRGIAELENNAGGNVIINTQGLVNLNTISSAVWSDTVINYNNITGSFGQYVGKKLLTLKNFLGLK